MVATSGDRLLAPDAVVALREILIPRALLSRPTCLRRRRCWTTTIAQDEDAMLSQGEALLKFGARRS